MKLSHLLISLSLLAACTPSQPEKGESGAPGSQGPKGNDGTKGDKGDPGFEGLSIGSRIERVAQIAVCEGRSGIKLTVWKESELRDGLMQNSEAASAQSSLVCDGEMGPQGQQGLAGMKGDKGETGISGTRGEKGDRGERGPSGIDGLSYSIVTESLSGSTQECSSTGGFRLMIWQDKNRDNKIDSQEQDSVTTQVLCNGARGSQGERGIEGRTSYNYSIQNMSLATRDGSPISNGRSSVLCSGDLISDSPYAFNQAYMEAKLKSNGQLLRSTQKIDSYEDGQYRYRFDLPAGWSQEGSELTCEIALINSFHANAYLAKGISPAAIVKASAANSLAGPQDLIQIRSGYSPQDKQLAIEFVIADDAPVTSNSCTMSLTKTLSGKREQASFKLKSGVSRLVFETLSLPPVFDPQLDRYSLECSGEEGSEGILRWSSAVFELNPAIIQTRLVSDSYNLQQSMISRPINWDAIGYFLPVEVNQRLREATLKNFDTLTSEETDAFMRFLLRTEQYAVLKSLPNLTRLYEGAMYRNNCSTEFGSLQHLSQVFGPLSTDTLKYLPSDCTWRELAYRASQIADKNWSYESFDTKHLESTEYLPYFKISNPANLAKLLSFALTSNSWNYRISTAQILEVIREQADLIKSEHASLWKDIIPKLADSGIPSEKDLAAWPALRLAIEQKFGSENFRSEEYRKWFESTSSSSRIDAVQRLGQQRSFLFMLGSSKALDEKISCQAIAQGFVQGTLNATDFRLIESSIESCKTELLPILQPLAAEIFSQSKSMPHYVAALLDVKGETAEELELLQASNDLSPVELIELSRRGKIDLADTLPLLLTKQLDKGFRLPTSDSYRAHLTRLSSALLTLLDKGPFPNSHSLNIASLNLLMDHISPEQYPMAQAIFLSKVLEGSQHPWMDSYLINWIASKGLPFSAEQKTLLSEHLGTTSHSIQAKIRLARLYRKAELDLSHLTTDLIETLTRGPQGDYPLKELGADPKLQVLLLELALHPTATLSRFDSYLEAVGCSADLTTKLTSLDTQEKNIKKWLSICYLAMPRLSDEQKALVLESIAEGYIPTSVSKQQSFIIPVLRDRLSKHFNEYLIETLADFAPIEPEIKGILEDLAQIYRANTHDYGIFQETLARI